MERERKKKRKRDKERNVLEGKRVIWRERKLSKK